MAGRGLTADRIAHCTEVQKFTKASFGANYRDSYVQLRRPTIGATVTVGVLPGSGARFSWFALHWVTAVNTGVRKCCVAVPQYCQDAAFAGSKRRFRCHAGVPLLNAGRDGFSARARAALHALEEARLRLGRARCSRCLGVALGVGALATVISVTGGFRAQFREKVLGVNAHVLILKYSSDFREYRKIMEQMKSVPGVIGIAPFVISPMMITHGDRTATGVLLKGVDPSRVKDVLDLPRHIVQGNMEGLRLPGAKPPERRTPRPARRLRLPRATAIRFGAEARTRRSARSGTGHAVRLGEREARCERGGSRSARVRSQTTHRSSTNQPCCTTSANRARRSAARARRAHPLEPVRRERCRRGATAAKAKTAKARRRRRARDGPGARSAASCPRGGYKSTLPDDDVSAAGHRSGSVSRRGIDQALTGHHHRRHAGEEPRREAERLHSGDEPHDRLHVHARRDARASRQAIPSHRRVRRGLRPIRLEARVHGSVPSAALLRYRRQRDRHRDEGERHRKGEGYRPRYRQRACRTASTTRWIGKS